MRLKVVLVKAEVVNVMVKVATVKEVGESGAGQDRGGESQGAGGEGELAIVKEVVEGRCEVATVKM